MEREVVRWRRRWELMVLKEVVVVRPLALDLGVGDKQLEWERKEGGRP